MRTNTAKIIPVEEMRDPDAAKKQEKDFPEGQGGIVGFVYDTWNTWAMERRQKEQTWLECEKAYLSKHSSIQGEQKWKTKAFVPASFTAVENIHAQLMNGLFPSPDFFTVEPAEDEFTLRASAVKEMLTQQLTQSGFRSGFSAFLKQLVMIGNSAAIIDWNTERSGTDVIFSGSRFIPLDMKYFHVDPFSAHPHTANKMRRYWMSHEEAEALGIFDEDALDEARGPGPGGIAATTEDSNRMTAAQTAELTTGIDPKRGDLAIVELWGTFEVEGRIYENHVASVGNGVLLRLQPSPFLHGRDPFIFGRYSIVPGEAYGIGALEPALPLQYLINTFTNQKSDELAIIINGMWKYIDDGVIDIDNLQAEPGALFEVGDMSNIAPLHPSKAVSLAYTEIADLERKFEEATGAIKLVAGGTPGVARTATEVMALTQSGNARFAELVADIEATSLVGALYKYLDNAKQFMKRDAVVKILGEDAEEFVTITEDDLQHGYSIRPGGSLLIGVREMRLRNLLQYAQIIGQIQPIAQRMDWDKFNKRIWRELGFDAGDSLLKDVQESPQIPAATQQPQQRQQQVPAQAPDLNAIIGQMQTGQEGGMPDGATGLQ